MKCSKCGVEHQAGNVVSLNWVCNGCSERPPQEVFHHLESLYKRGAPSRYLYVSGKVGNLQKVQQHFTESVEMDNPFCTVTLVRPEGVFMLSTTFDGIFLDLNCMAEGDMEEVRMVLAPEGSFVRYVDPDTLIVHD